MLLPVHRVDCDVAVVGSGFAGSIAALCLCRLGRRVVLIERGRHPRFAIGESSTPLANLLLEEIADRYDLPRLRVLSKWGTWQGARPEIACGLKRGFSFFFHQPGQPFADGVDHSRQLMVAASPCDEIADTHWYRAEFDHALVREAEAAGVIYVDDTRLDSVRQAGDVIVLEGICAGRRIVIPSRFVVDASGPRGFLHHALGLGEVTLNWLPPTQALFTHFTNVARWDDVEPSEGQPPFPADDAALHHVFPGGWIWVLRFNNGISSAGAALTAPLASTIDARAGRSAWHALLDSLPSVRAQFADAREALPWHHLPRLAFRTRQVWGPRWALLPSAAGIVDPLLSTGFALTLLGLDRLLRVLERWNDSGDSEGESALRQYGEATANELDVTERLVASLYATMADAELFKRLALLYFAAASYSEAARRLGRAERARGFLLEADPVFGAALRACAALGLGSPHNGARTGLLARIDRAIATVDVAGLSDRSRRDWYPVLATDLLASAGTLGATHEDIRGLLSRAGWIERAV